METIVSTIVAFVAAGFLIVGAAATGNLPELCERIGGTYQPAGPDACPDGDWSRLVIKQEKK